MRANTYEILQRCLEEGASYGYERAFKHLDTGQQPSKDALIESILNGIRLEICTYFDFDGKDFN